VQREPDAERVKWDLRKAEKNFRKHGVSFEVAQEAIDDPLSVTVVDPNHSYGETRYITVGCTRAGEFLVLSHTSREGRIRLISARRATKAEIRRYMNREYEIRDEEDDEMLPEYDFTNGVRGMFAPKGEVHHYRVDADLVEYFPTSSYLNETLRRLIAEGHIQPAKVNIDDDK
jgi:uncharacterized DUF497 family protein